MSREPATLEVITETADSMMQEPWNKNLFGEA